MMHELRNRVSILSLMICSMVTNQSELVNLKNFDTFVVFIIIKHYLSF